MKSGIAIVIALALGAGAADAQCNRDLITVTGWTVVLLGTEPSLRFRLDVSVRLNADRPIRMIDGSIAFADVLGSRIASMRMDPDISLAPGEAHVFTGHWGANTFERLLDMKPEDAVATTCIRGVVHADGEVVTYTQ